MQSRLKPTKRSSAWVWYAVSVISYLVFKSRTPSGFYVMEDVVLVRARSFKEAKRKALAQESPSNGFSPDAQIRFGRDAQRVVAGVRKIVTCAPAVAGPKRISNGLEDGAEATWSNFKVKNRAELNALVRGESVRLTYEAQNTPVHPRWASLLEGRRKRS